MTDGAPKTEQSLREDLLRLGVERGTVLMVHSSLRSLGWVVGGAPTVIRALLDVLGDEGTLVMPAATPHCADPADWSGPKIPSSWLRTVRDHLPVFDSDTTPTSMGTIPETFRRWPGTLRSPHPLESVCARGPLASQISRNHPLAFSEGPGGPFEELYDSQSQILLVGVGFNRCTALHFAETLVEKRRTMTVRFPVIEKGRRKWLEVPNVADDNGLHFPVVGESFLQTGRVKTDRIGEARSMLVPMRDLVDFAVTHFNQVL